MSDAPSPHAISPAEWEVMKVLWERGPLAARDVFAALPDDRDWAYKTVKTLLSRLVAKGALEYDQIGNSYLYRAAVAQEQMSRQEIQSVFSRIVSKAISPVLAHMIEEADLTDEDIELLKQTLQQKRPKQPAGKRSRRKKS